MADESPNLEIRGQAYDYPQFPASRFNFQGARINRHGGHC